MSFLAASTARERERNEFLADLSDIYLLICTATNPPACICPQILVFE
jgi:hypothetical protein